MRQDDIQVESAQDYHRRVGRIADAKGAASVGAQQAIENNQVQQAKVKDRKSGQNVPLAGSASSLRDPH